MSSEPNHPSNPAGGRQSPDPESQAPQQGKSAPGSGEIGEGGPGETAGKDKSEEHKHDGLESNPKGPLDNAAADKTKKTM